ncbi:MAG TPA: hypothetical protein VHY36_13400 [Steroidobacteraceae bacterium]|nr:hypothetical protein [Steroidobacteraceae bacterium]
MNTLIILSEDPWIAELADCLTCGATLPADWPTIESPAPKGGVCRYRVCSSCTLATALHSLVGGSGLERWRANVSKRLEQHFREIARNSMILANTPSEESRQ